MKSQLLHYMVNFPIPFRMNTTLHIAHVLRKYNANEWAGTETVLKEMFECWGKQVNSTLFCPSTSTNSSGLFDAISIERYEAFLPILGLSEENKKRLISIGGNLMSFDLAGKLAAHKDLSLIHSHTLGLLGAIAEKTARRMGIPFVLSIHGGALDLPKESLEQLIAPQKDGIAWGKVFSLYLRPDRILEKADAIITFNPKEEMLLKQKMPEKKIVYIPHGIHLEKYQQDQRRQALEAFPFLKDRSFGLVPARIDPVKNQLWLIEQFPEIRKKWPAFELVLAGPVTNSAYFEQIQQRIKELGLNNTVHIVGAFPYDDARLIGLLQAAKYVILPSIAEPFGRVVLEAWAAGTPIVASRTSGIEGLIAPGENGSIFEHDDVLSLLQGMEKIHSGMIDQAKRWVAQHYDIRISSAKVLEIYKELIL